MTTAIRRGWRALAIAAGIVLWLSGAASNGAAGDLQVTVGNPGLAHFDSDGGVELDFGLTDQSGQPVGNLTKDNVQVLEDGVPGKILYFHGVGQGRPVDIVFVLDVTESMQPYIDAVKQNITNFAEELKNNNRDFRLGLVTFEDYVISQYPDCNCEYRSALTTDVQKFIGWVGALHAGGGGDIPEDQLDGLAYAATLPFRPEAQAIVILITDAPPHVAGDGPDREGDTAYQQHHPDVNADVTEQTGAKVAALYEKDGLTLYAVAPPPFIAPEYANVVQATHGRLYNIVTEQSRFPELVNEIGHSIATEYSLTYLTPRPIEDGTTRAVQLRINYNGESGAADTSYQVKGIGGAAINEPVAGNGASGESAPRFAQVAFSWWNGVIPLIALLGLVTLSRMRFGVSAEELKAIVEAQSKAPAPNLAAAARQVAERARAVATPSAPAARPSAPPAPRVMTPVTISGAGAPHEARLTTVDRLDSIPAEYALLKPEVAVGRGEDNDIVIPHASVSRNHARLVRRDGAFELIDLNSTNGSYVNGQTVQGSARIASGSEVRFGDIRFNLRF
ncbi:MAG TPA: FHA domain-containing protein [Candidatus Binataceae bacterium]|nr:FHA domain-containing protein [Candidatus Binataceae bacterium]